VEGEAGGSCTARPLGQLPVNEGGHTFGRASCDRGRAAAGAHGLFGAPQPH